MNCCKYSYVYAYTHTASGSVSFDEGDISLNDLISFQSADDIKESSSSSKCKHTVQVRNQGEIGLESGRSLLLSKGSLHCLPLTDVQNVSQAGKCELTESEDVYV